MMSHVSVFWGTLLRTQSPLQNSDSGLPSARISKRAAVGSCGQAREKISEDSQSIRSMIGCPKNFIHRLERLMTDMGMELWCSIGTMASALHKSHLAMPRAGVV